MMRRGSEWDVGDERVFMGWGFECWLDFLSLLFTQGLLTQTKIDK